MTLGQYFTVKWHHLEKSHFSVRNAELQLIRCGAQTKTDSGKRQTAVDAQWNDGSATLSQIWPQVNSLCFRTPKFTEVSSTFNTYIFSPTSDPLDIEQRFCHRVSLCETDGMIPNLIRKRSRSRLDLSSGKLKVNYVAYIRHLFGMIRQTYWCYFHSSITPGSKVIGKNFFPIGL